VPAAPVVAPVAAPAAPVVVPAAPNIAPAAGPVSAAPAVAAPPAPAAGPAFIAAANRYERMPYRRAGYSGLMLPAVSLGFWHNFGADAPLDRQRAVALRAFDLGITHFDLANNYGPPPGSAETNLGRIIAGDLRSHRDELIISTKAGYEMWPGPYGEWGSRKYMLASLDASLRRLGLDYVDIFYSHRPDPNTPLEETMGALESAVRAGKALYAGISNYGPGQARQAAACMRGFGTPLLSHQPSYSMLNRRPEIGLLDALGEERVGCIVFSPLAQGLLTDRYLAGIPAGSRVTHSPFLTETMVKANLPRIRALNKIATCRGQTLAQMALTWVLRDERVTSAIVGASSVEQLEANVRAIEGPPLQESELAEIDGLCPRPEPPAHAPAPAGQPGQPTPERTEGR
jgi:L-glyceraldehyde 3-phosphate reductase